jgi:hypothetical protein
VNVDGAYNLTTDEAAIGIITRDHEGQPHIVAWRVVTLLEKWFISTPGYKYWCRLVTVADINND